MYNFINKRRPVPIFPLKCYSLGYMKHNQNGSANLILISIFVVIISGALTYAFLSNAAKTKAPATSPVVAAQTKKTSSNQAQSYVLFEDWKVRFSSNTKYTVKLNSASTNQSSYFIADQALAQTCSMPETPWLGIIQRFEDPDQKATIGPDTGKTMNEIYGTTGKIINGSLYYFSTATQFCTRNATNLEIDQAAKTLETEIKSLEAY